MKRPRLVVVQISESFAGFWATVTADVGAECEVIDVHSPALGGDLAAVVLSAGGCEREALEWLNRNDLTNGVPVFAVGADPSRRLGLQMVRQGALDYFALPEDLELCSNSIASAVERRLRVMNQRAVDHLTVKAEAFNEIVGESPALRSVLARAACILPHTDATALIVGETGTGKELLAQALHHGGPRQHAPFVSVNCSAVPENLVESELFGHERGAFTDAHVAKPGLFELADGGTLFLDELGTLPVNTQAKLLRVLEDGVIRRVGSTKSRRLNVRIVAATNEDLAEGVQKGTIRTDLFFRLSVITLDLPPLRERGDDVLLLASVMAERLAKQYGLPIPELDSDVRKALTVHSWPGNVRELKNAMERALLLSPPGTLNVEELLPKGSTKASTSFGPFPSRLDTIVNAAAVATLEYCGGNRSAAARHLGISRQRLRRLLTPDGVSGTPSEGDSRNAMYD